MTLADRLARIDWSVLAEEVDQEGYSVVPSLLCVSGCQDVIHYYSSPDFLRDCHENGQNRPTPLLLKYVSGDFNRLHQDLYGEIAFPFQLAICLNQPGEDFVGGEFVFTEQRPRMRTRAQVVPLGRGDAVVFANRYRPVNSARGYSRATFRHGVSQVKRGTRHCLGIIFHDAS